MANSTPLPFIAHNSTVKAWCVTRLLHNSSILEMTQSAFDTLNFLDGYNLRLDVITRNGFDVSNTSPILSDGAIRFSFINPLPDNRYKVFLSIASNYQSVSKETTQMTVELLNSSLYPKTTTGFWVRASVAYIGGSSAITGLRFFPNNTQIRAVVL